MEPIRILLVEDQTLMRQGLKTILDLEPGLQVVGEASDGEAGVQAALELRPDTASRSGHYGLRGMRERLEGLGGTLTLHNNGQRGTLVEACLPIITASRQPAAVGGLTAANQPC